jgi:hypothetical protein
MAGLAASTWEYASAGTEVSFSDTDRDVAAGQRPDEDE